MGLENRKVFVTGASRGIGKAIAQAFRDEGAWVVGTSTAAGGASGDQCHEWVQADFSSISEIEGCARRIGEIRVGSLVEVRQPQHRGLEPRVGVGKQAVPGEHGGPGVSIQAFHLLSKIREVDQYLQSERPTSRSRFVEVHPELAFQSLHGGPLQFSKRTKGGQAERLEILAGVGLRIDPMPVVRRGVVEIDDVIDAAVVACTAMRVLRGTAQCIPDPPETFSDGLPAAIWF